MSASMTSQLLDYLASGGFVMTPLALGTVVLWFALGWRFFTLRRGSHAPLRALVGRYHGPPSSWPGSRGIIDRAARRGVLLAQARADRGWRRQLRRQLDEDFGQLNAELRRFEVLVTSIVAAAPLIGLLGTVSGMIETFDALADMTLFSQSGGIAGGISQALISTQMGLAVAIPGLLAGRLLQRRQRQLSDELEELKDHLCAQRS